MLGLANRTEETSAICWLKGDDYAAGVTAFSPDEFETVGSYEIANEPFIKGVGRFPAYKQVFIGNAPETGAWDPLA